MLRTALFMLLLAPVAAPAAPAAVTHAGARAGACRPKKKGRKKPKRPRPAAPPAAVQAPPAAPTSAPAPDDDGATPALRRSNRMEFDARLVKGERATGAVYLFQRVPRRLPPLVQLAPDPLDRIVRPVLHRGVDAAPEPAAPTGEARP